MSAEPSEPDSSKRGSKRSAVRTTTVLGLFGLFVAAVLVVLVRRAFPGRQSRGLAQTLRRRR